MTRALGTRAQGEDARFHGCQYSVVAVAEHQFPKLSLRHKPNLVSFNGGTASLPLTDPSQRATKLQPAEFQQQLNVLTDAIVLDVRNDYEWDCGHFEGSARPTNQRFRETDLSAPGQPLHDKPKCALSPSRPRSWLLPRGAPPCSDPRRRSRPSPDSSLCPCLVAPCRRAHEARARALMSGAHGRRRDTPILMYCTGGIRCDVYSAKLRQEGFNNMYTLAGGVQVRPRVFDGRGGALTSTQSVSAGGGGCAPALRVRCHGR